MAQFQLLEDLAFKSLMASSEVDQKFLGRFARGTHHANPFLSAMLYKVLGLSVLLSKKLIRARRLRRLDTTRDTKSLQLYHHIIWLGREGLIILEEYVLPMIDSYAFEVQVLSHKLRASFYHIFVLFHNQPSIHQAAIPSFASIDALKAAQADGLKSALRMPANIGQVTEKLGAGAGLPPGLTPISLPKPAASFLLPARNYVPDASTYFSYAAQLADHSLPGSHPVRLSVKIEYAAYLYDCLHDGEASRKLAQAAVKDVYNAPEGMDDDMFEDAAEQVAILGRMMRRGLKGVGRKEGGGETPRDQLVRDRAGGAGSSSFPGSEASRSIKSTPMSTPRVPATPIGGDPRKASVRGNIERVDEALTKSERQASRNAPSRGHRPHRKIEDNGNDKGSGSNSNSDKDKRKDKQQNEKIRSLASTTRSTGPSSSSKTNQSHRRRRSP